jgi:HK97 family phage prohead protease
MKTETRFLSFDSGSAALGDRTIKAIASTGALARDGSVWDMQGGDLTNFRRNPIVLFMHNQAAPVGTADVLLTGNRMETTITFAPAGVSARADEVCGLAKAGILKGVSCAITIRECVPIDPTKPRGGQRVTKWELLEISIVSVPADASALVTQRAHTDSDYAERQRTLRRLRVAGLEDINRPTAEDLEYEQRLRTVRELDLPLEERRRVARELEKPKA